MVLADALAAVIIRGLLSWGKKGSGVDCGNRLATLDRRRPQTTPDPARVLGSSRMATKKTGNKSGGDRLPRKQPYSGQRLGVVIERVRDQATRLAALARTIDEAKLDGVVIDGHAMLLRGLNQIDNFIDNASRAVREAKVKREGI